MEDYIQDEKMRLHWLESKMNDSIETWLSDTNKPSLVNPIYIKQMISRIINNEVDFLFEEPEEHLSLYGQDLYGKDGKDIFE